MSTTTLVRHAAKKECECECGPSECCELECLVHPRFFCGQLLADQDLTALVDWTKAKTALARYREGWGVVCGFHVHCARNGKVTVSAGYARDCCGRDLVGCEETTFDLTTCWERPDDPCAIPGIKTPDTPREPDAGEDAGEPSFGPFAVDPREVQSFDLMVRYSEAEKEPRTALARGGCGGEAGCEYTRVHETIELYCRPARDCEDPAANEARLWDDTYRNELQNILKWLLALVPNQDLSADQARMIAGRFLQYLDDHPLETFCFVRQWLCDVARTGNVTIDDLQQAVLWFVHDWRNAYFRGPCPGCGPDTGVLLARVWVWMRRVNNRETFSVLQIESHPPFRRLLAKDEFPAPPGRFNAAPLIWNEADDVVMELRDRGVLLIGQREFGYGDLDGLLTRDSLFIRPGFDPTIVLFVRDRCGRKRAVAFMQMPLRDLLTGGPMASFSSVTNRMMAAEEEKEAPPRPAPRAPKARERGGIPDVEIAQAGELEKIQRELSEKPTAAEKKESKKRSNRRKPE